MESDNNSDGRREGDGCKDDAPKKPVFLSHNFDEYRRMRAEAATARRHEQAGEKNITDEGWNHFTGPLKPMRPSLDQMEQAERQRPKPAKPSAFSDLERSQTVDRFGSIFMERIGAAVSSGKLARAWQGGDGGGSMFSWLTKDYSQDADESKRRINSINPEDYSAERRLIEPHLTPVVWGSSCMVVTLLSMRLGRWHQGRNAVRVGGGIDRSAQQRSAAHVPNNNIKSLKDARHARHNQSPFNPREEMTNDLQSNLVTLPVDIALSLLVGISTTLFLTRPHYLMDDVANAPLLEGRSALSEELCLPFREEIWDMNRQFYTFTPKSHSSSGDDVEQRQTIPYSEIWKDENLGNFDSLRAVRDFVANCRKRENAAKNMVEVDGRELSEQELLEVPVPAPGVSPDMADGELEQYTIE